MLHLHWGGKRYTCELEQNGRSLTIKMNVWTTVSTGFQEERKCWGWTSRAIPGAGVRTYARLWKIGNIHIVKKGSILKCLKWSYMSKSLDPCLGHAFWSSLQRTVPTKLTHLCQLWSQGSCLGEGQEERFERSAMSASSRVLSTEARSHFWAFAFTISLFWNMFSPTHPVLCLMYAELHSAVPHGVFPNHPV